MLGDILSLIRELKQLSPEIKVVRNVSKNPSLTLPFNKELSYVSWTLAKLAKHARCDQPSFEQKEKKKVEVDHAKWHLARYKV